MMKKSQVSHCTLMVTVAPSVANSWHRTLRNPGQRVESPHAQCQTCMPKADLIQSTPVQADPCAWHTRAAGHTKADEQAAVCPAVQPMQTRRKPFQSQVNTRNAQQMQSINSVPVAQCHIGSTLHALQALHAR
jgi:hypothetical protein